MTGHGVATEPRPGRGIAAMVLAIFLFATMDMMVKLLRMDGFGPLQVLFFRFFFALIPLVWLVRSEGGLPVLRTRRLTGHIGRTLLTITALGCFFYAFGIMPLADAYGVSYAAPLMITALSVPMLGEKVGLRRWAAVAVGFLGVLIILRPGGGMLSGGGVVMLIGTLLYAFNIVLLRQLSRTESNATILFYFTVTGTLVTGLALPFDWRWPDAQHWPMLIAIGVIGGFAQTFITEAFRCAPVAVVSPFQYSSLLWGLGYGFFVFGDQPDLAMLIGSVVIIGSGLYILHRETVRREAGPAPGPRVPP